MNTTLDLLSIPIFMLALFALTIFPVKIGADLFGAPNNAIKYCAITVLMQMAAVVFVLVIAKGFFGCCVHVYCYVNDLLASSQGLAHLVVCIHSVHIPYSDRYVCIHSKAASPADVGWNQRLRFSRCLPCLKTKGFDKSSPAVAAYKREARLLI